jgi:hypothetical protein
MIMRKTLFNLTVKNEIQYDYQIHPETKGEKLKWQAGEEI